ncbi:peptidylprolyl isomerase [Candidatus Berkiella aquae]|uniref:Chaperone SurA n=1 Tax=Candidatus Berkiella aquae TaxID=295108 RepID=A0A0Q9YXR7_9GAMM|nr:peptidylprolyl isomerase [Candidatus Berkiella aquae]MCS5710113.1 peptidylprolyl isomerase [Candidatus Berkiella aquae]
MRILKALIGCLVVSTCVYAKPQPIDGIAAIVNDSVITRSELRNELEMVKQQILHSGNTAPEHSILEKQVLEHLIVNEIQLQMAKKTGLQVDDNALDNAISTIAKQNGLSVTQLREAVNSQGMDYNQYRDNVRRQMTVSQLQQRDVLSGIQISEQEINQFLQSPNGLGSMVSEYRLGHILLSLPESPSPVEIEAAAQKAQLIVNKLRQGEDFATLAMAESQGEGALQGGDLGWRRLPELPTLFEKIVPTLKAQDVPEPIRSNSGIHIIKLLEKRTAQQAIATIEKFRVRHILIKTNTVTSDRDALARLNEIRSKLNKGETFTQLAKAYSQDLASATNGGDLGWITKDVLVPEFAEAMEKLALNELSEPVKTPFGWHLIEVQEKQAHASDDTALRQKARDMLQQRKFEEKQQEWVRQLRDEAYVKMPTDNVHS